jgi:uncharacterized membrane protein HdeD (DUF308 family)
MTEAANWPFRGGLSFVRILGILVAALGAVALFGPELAHATIVRVVGLLLALAGALTLLAWISARSQVRGRIVLTWALSALGAGVLIEILPAHGVVSAGVLVGMALLFHGIATSLIALKGWRTKDLIALLACLAAPLLVIVGVALVIGGGPGERGEEIVIGVDMLLFGAYMTVGRTLLAYAELDGGASRSPSTSSR